MKKLSIISFSVVCTLGSVSTTNAALFSRMGGDAYYDDVLNITWLADANYAQTSGFDADGEMNWANANAWANTLIINGYSGWRLPTTNPINGSTYNLSSSPGTNAEGIIDDGYNISAPGTIFAGNTGSEMAHLFYNTLGNVSDYNELGVFVDGCPGTLLGECLVNTGPFANIQAPAGNTSYWSSSAPLSGSAFRFTPRLGSQSLHATGAEHFSWAVHDGDIGAVPVPAAVWLFGSGLIVLLGFSRKNKA